MVSYAWNFGDGNVATQPNPAHVYEQDGIYTVLAELEDENGCAYNVTGEVEITAVIQLTVPSAFSPNGDGKNDRFYIGSQNLRSIDFAIYSRWGKEVYRTQALDFRWDGKTAGGADVPQGFYTFRVFAQDLDGQTINQSGTITLIR